MTRISNIKSIAIIGAGTMGREIAQVSLMAGFNKVILNDIKKDILNQAVQFIESGLKKIESKNKLNENTSTNLLMKNLFIEMDLEKAVAKIDFVIEAVPEIMELKQDLFKKLGNYSPKQAILATNTSTMSITKIAQSSKRPDKVIGMHFFTPVPILRLIELIRGKETSDETVKIALEVGHRFPALKGKRLLPVLEKESPGFIVNRLTISTSLYLSWVLDYAIDNNIPLGNIDADAELLTELGPFAKWDYLGLDIVYNTLNYFSEVVSPQFSPGKNLTRLVNEGNLGRKTGKGLYQWKEGKPIINKTKKAELFNLDLYMAIQLNEGCRLLEEGIVSGYKIIDDTMIAGMDMPGPFGAGKRNYKKWTELLENFVQKSGLTYLSPCDLMKSGEFINLRK